MRREHTRLLAARVAMIHKLREMDVVVVAVSKLFVQET